MTIMSFGIWRLKFWIVRDWDTIQNPFEVHSFWIHFERFIQCDHWHINHKCDIKCSLLMYVCKHIWILRLWLVFSTILSHNSLSSTKWVEWSLMSFLSLKYDRRQLDQVGKDLQSDTTSTLMVNPIWTKKNTKHILTNWYWWADIKKPLQAFLGSSLLLGFGTCLQPTTSGHPTTFFAIIFFLLEWEFQENFVFLHFVMGRLLHNSHFKCTSPSRPKI